MCHYLMLFQPHNEDILAANTEKLPSSDDLTYLTFERCWVPPDISFANSANVQDEVTMIIWALKIKCNSFSKNIFKGRALKNDSL